MDTKSLFPPPEISGSVSSILVIESPENIGSFSIPLYANGSPTMVFHSSRAFQQDAAIDNLTLYGQTILPGELTVNGAFTLIAYFLHPHTLKSIFQINAAELTDGHIDVNYLKSARELNLREQLLNASSTQHRLTLLNKFILKASLRDNGDHNRIFTATNELKANVAGLSLINLQDKLNTTGRTLHRLFKANVGMSPQTFKRVCQFHQAFQRLNYYEFDKLTDIAYDSGFTDQSHFIRVFREFTGITPSEYLARRNGYDPNF